MNPSLYTKWLYKHDGYEYRIKIVGIWGRGFRDNYTVTAYELKHDNKQEIDRVTAKDMKAMIADGKLTYLAPAAEVVADQRLRLKSRTCIKA